MKNGDIEQTTKKDSKETELIRVTLPRSALDKIENATGLPFKDWLKNNINRLADNSDLFSAREEFAKTNIQLTEFLNKTTLIFDATNRTQAQIKSVLDQFHSQRAANQLLMQRLSEFEISVNKIVSSTESSIIDNKKMILLSVQSLRSLLDTLSIPATTVHSINESAKLINESIHQLFKEGD